MCGKDRTTMFELPVFNKYLTILNYHTLLLLLLQIRYFTNQNIQTRTTIIIIIIIKIKCLHQNEATAKMFQVT